ncbi:hypothetical protein FN846DRAFT_903862 [Sphaerosporella brunnea]|uniref:DUF6826 domain-containing protein n=1 Tax=Sphaerosporella brunnea TaxID=1250544 RepID=A0A5J5F608_9PEZI|nr:hypothetical protein FN846DRAFT_903862 [Sphaerosporella brunnea]
MPVTDGALLDWFEQLSRSNVSPDVPTVGGYETFCGGLQQLVLMLNKDNTRETVLAMDKPKSIWRQVVMDARTSFEQEEKVRAAEKDEEVRRLRNEINELTERTQSQTEKRRNKIDQLRMEIKELRQNRNRQMDPLLMEIRMLKQERKRHTQIVTCMPNMERDFAAAPQTRSATRAGRWQALTAENTVQRDDLPLKDLADLSSGEKSLITTLINIEFPTEISMYNPMVLVFRRLLGDPSNVEKIPDRDSPHALMESTYQALRQGTTSDTKLAAVFQTHDNYCLNRYAPDLTICHKEAIIEDPENIVCIVEVKPVTTVSFDSQMFGQANDYLQATVRAQPHRRYVVAVLTSLKLDAVLMHDSSTKLTTVYHPCTFVDVIRYLRHVVLVEPAYGVAPAPFAADLGLPVQYLGKQRRTAVASFFVPDALRAGLTSRSDEPLSDCCTGFMKKDSKRSQERIFCHSNRVSCTPQLMAVKRVVDKIDPRKLASRGRTYNRSSVSTTKVSDEIKILLLIQKLGVPSCLPMLLYHTADFKELGTAPVGKPIRGVLINLGEATQVNMNTDQVFRGGYICCPLRLMECMEEAPDKYYPVPSDDYTAWMLLVNTWMYPTQWKSVISAGSRVLHEGSTAQSTLMTFWIESVKLYPWDSFYDAAICSDVNRLREFAGLIHSA